MQHTKILLKNITDVYFSKLWQLLLKCFCYIFSAGKEIWVSSRLPMSHLGSKYEKQDVAFMYYGYMHECRRRVARMWRAKLRDILTKTTSTSTTVKQLRFNNNWDSGAIKTSQAWRYKTRVNKQASF